ncbi:response regulator [Pradoshia sp. D12]|uniref:response regulator n=1 Tax=Bacillaceae TaxID=186817 RepID=UPI00112CB4D3|nr:MULTISPECIES: response regulator [Bacillaceae]QFK71627.1 response regulator [Pradoshia sp. D12]TPF73422.1 response regulator [Bacillus sp. D12]
MVKDDGICRILIVDDEILIRQGIKHYLDWESEGFQIVGEASNGQEALEMIEVLSPHIIITDIVMPIMNGEELTRVVKEKYPQIEVIILSSYGEFDYVRSAFQCGVVDYILKPKLEAQSLLKVLKTAVKRIPGFQSREKELNVSLSIDQIINRLVLGYDVHFDSKQIIRAFPYSHYSLLGVDLKKHPSKGAAEFLIQVKTKVENVFNKKISEVSYYSFNYDPHIIVFLLNTN